MFVRQGRLVAQLSTQANAPAERFVRTIKESCLDRLILFGEESLWTAVSQFVTHYHRERSHQGLGNRLLRPEPCHVGNTGVVQQQQRLGGLLNYYDRAAARLGEHSNIRTLRARK
jgi:putative transposase